MIKKSNVYTATGDGGQTSLASGQRVAKDDVRLEAYGTVDELNSFIGMLDNLHNIPGDTKEVLRIVQNKLFNIGGYLATDSADIDRCFGLDETDVSRLEHFIDVLDSELPPLRRFVLPGGSRISSVSHVCRSVCRRCERRVISLQHAGVKVDPNVVKYLNRLSDFFFVLARFNNIHNQIEEIFWDKDCK